MPNWCEQDLNVTGKTSDIAAFKQAIKTNDKGELDLCDSFFPMPDLIREHDGENYKPVADEAERQAWIAQRVKNDHPFGAVHPPLTQAEWNECVSKYGTPSWYAWANRNWGTKWGDCHTKVESEETYGDTTELKITFETAWSPMPNVIAKAAERFPQLTFELCYFESGLGFNGYIRWENGAEAGAESGAYFGERGG